MIKILLWANTIFELTIGMVILIAPRLLFPDMVLANRGESAILMVSLTRTIGITALSIGLLSALLSLRTLTSELKFAGLGALAAFHLGMTLVHFLNVIEGLVPFPVMIIHGFFAIIFLSIFIWNAK